MIRAPLVESVDALRRALRSAEVAPADLHALLLIGGSSRTPLVADFVLRELNLRSVVGVHPKNAVALGAALAADRLGSPPQTPNAATTPTHPPQPAGPSAEKLPDPQPRSMQTPKPEFAGAPTGETPSTPAVDEQTIDDDVQFTVYRPSAIRPSIWYTMLAFAHKTEVFVDQETGPVDPLAEVEHRAEERLGEDFDRYLKTTGDIKRPLPSGSEIRFVPDVDGVEFNPSQCIFRWTEPIHEQQFRFRGGSCAGRYVGPGKAGRLLRNRTYWRSEHCCSRWSTRG